MVFLGASVVRRMRGASVPAGPMEHSEKHAAATLLWKKRFAHTYLGARIAVLSAYVTTHAASRPFVIPLDLKRRACVQIAPGSVLPSILWPTH